MPAPRTTGRTARAAQTQGKKFSANMTGSAGIKQMEAEMARREAEEEARKNSVREPFRFFVTPGETREAVIIDEGLDFFRREHQLQNKKTQRWDRYLPCIDDQTNCPVCEIADKEASFNLYLTIIDLTPYTTSNGDEVQWSKKMLVVKLNQQKKFARWYEKYGSLRGMVISFTRDKQKESNIGGSIEFDGEVMTDEQLAEYYTEYEDKDKNIVEIFGDEVFPYEEIYPDMTEQQLRALIGGKPTTSREDDERAVGSTRRARPTGRRVDTEEDEGADQRRAPRSSSRRPAREEEEDAPAPRRASRRTVDEEPEEQEPPRRGTRQAAPTGRRAARREEPAEDADDAPETDDEQAVSTRRTPRSARRTEVEEEAPAPQQRTRAARRPTVQEEDTSVDNTLPDEQEDDAPAPSTASRRAGLRRAR